MIRLLSMILSGALSALPTTLHLDTANKQSSASYTATHKLHKFTGTTHDLAGVARILPDGTVQLQIRAPVAGFDSENGNRDEHMKETVEAIKYPDLTVKCLAHLKGRDSQQVNSDCEFTLHGQTQKVSVPVDLTFVSPTQVRARGAFAVSWDGFGIKRPQLLFVPIEDRGDIAFDVAFSE